MIDHPSDQTLIWSIGIEGNEGKTFLQKYIKQIYGTHCVLKTELNASKSDVVYMLPQTSLTCKDIFLFNLLRSDAEVAYGLLENIKDGYLVSVKYKTKEVKIKIPNVIIPMKSNFPNIGGEYIQLMTMNWKWLILKNEVILLDMELVMGK